MSDRILDMLRYLSILEIWMHLKLRPVYAAPALTACFAAVPDWTASEQYFKNIIGLQKLEQPWTMVFKLCQ